MYNHCGLNTPIHFIEMSSVHPAEMRKATLEPAKCMLNKYLKLWEFLVEYFAATGLGRIFCEIMVIKRAYWKLGQWVTCQKMITNTAKRQLLQDLPLSTRIYSCSSKYSSLCRQRWELLNTQLSCTEPGHPKLYDVKIARWSHVAWMTSYVWCQK